MKPAIVFAAFLLLCGAIMAQPGQPPQDPFTLSIDVDMVLFNVNVLDYKGRQIPGLTKDNFKLSEDGVEHNISSFQAEGSPATVGLIIDNSGSMMRKRPHVVTTAFSFLRDSNPADEIFIVNFNDKVWKGLPDSVAFSHDIGELRSSLLATRSVGKTALYDGVAAGLQHLATGRHQRKALIVLSDGGDTSSRLKLDGVLDLIRKSNATIYTIGIFDPADQDKNPDVLKDIAKAAAGEAFIPRELEDLPQVWASIGGSLRGQYTLGFFSKNTSPGAAYRKVKIVATDKSGKGLQVRTRDGYSIR